MNRMNWITYLKVLFDQLESFNQNKQKHVDNLNFTKGLKKIKSLLPLMPRNDYYKNASDVAFTYKEVEQGVVSMPKYINWDMVIDIFLAKSFAQAMTNNPHTVGAFQQINSNEVYPEPQQIEESHFSDVQYEVDDYDMGSFNERGQNSKFKRSGMINSVQQQDNSN